MAKPDLTCGWWYRLSGELLAAVMLAEFTASQRAVLLEVFEQIYGPDKRRWAELSASAIAVATGRERARISSAISSLVKMGVLGIHSPGLYRFIKDYEAWRRDGERMLSQKSIKRAKTAPNRLKAKPDVEPAESLAAEGVPQTAQSAVPQTAQCAPNGTEVCPSWHTYCAPTGTVHYRNARGLDSEEELKTPLTPPRGEGVGVSHPDQPQVDEPFNAPIDGCGFGICGSGRTSPEAVALGKWAERLGEDRTGLAYSTWAIAQCDDYPADWVRAALKEFIAARPGDPYSRNYMRGALRNWASEGRCPLLDPPAPSKPKLKPAAPEIPEVKPPPGWKPPRARRPDEPRPTTVSLQEVLRKREQSS